MGRGERWAIHDREPRKATFFCGEKALPPELSSPHKFTCVNDFSGLTALLCNFFRVLCSDFQGLVLRRREVASRTLRSAGGRTLGRVLFVLPLSRRQVVVPAKAGIQPEPDCEQSSEGPYREEGSDLENINFAEHAAIVVFFSEISKKLLRDSGFAAPSAYDAIVVPDCT
jgi:hypothetical protein